ncbi:hypothetical protein BCR35DRAFT_336155 [Leucosporidium creatinivorum]|uniref:Uncharacterized protein n=1 Tax=Leucosporidium creatinivorum TaxID=106004 RepID=A0A1Y2CKM7_9BASI|nr:hypothetical protein BCR35DRAFT_336155 [Leucosporidium creatinivorum]
MAITEQQAIEWAADLCRQMMLVSTGLAHCFLAGGPQPPIFNWPPGSAQEEGWCQAFLRRDGRKRQTLDGTQSSKTTLANKKAADDPPFFMSFGHQSNIRAWENHFPFLQLMFDPDISAIMYRYVAEAVQWMMKGGGSHSNFQHLLWVGLRDWNTSSAWTRGVVLIYARRSCKKRTIATSKCNSIK